MKFRQTIGLLLVGTLAGMLATVGACSTENTTTDGDGGAGSVATSGAGANGSGGSSPGSGGKVNPCQGGCGGDGQGGSTVGNGGNGGMGGSGGMGGMGGEVVTSAASTAAATGGAGGMSGQSCGNGIKEGTEECDDGNTVHCDGCFHTCEQGQVFLEIGGYDKQTSELLIRGRNCVDIYGFQFHLTGVTVTGASGGTAQQHGWTMGTNASGMVLGFHLSLVPIPSQNGVAQVLTRVAIVPPLPNTEVCIIDDSTLVISDTNGQAIAAAADDCITL